MKSLSSVFLGCAGAVLAQNPQSKQEPRAKQENAPPQPMSSQPDGRVFAVIP